MFKIDTISGTITYSDITSLICPKGPVTLGYGLTRSHAEGAKALHRESAPVSVGMHL